MAKKNLLLVDADPQGLRVLEVSLRKAGHNVATATDATSALSLLESSTPDLILADTELPGMNGFELVRALHEDPRWTSIPTMFLSSDGSIESRVKGLELGVEDFLTKPVYIREVLARVHLNLQRAEQGGLRRSDARTRFTGTLDEMGVADLLQTIELSAKTGVLTLTGPSGEPGQLFFENGAVVDAQAGSLGAADAIYRFLRWNEGEFALEFRAVRTARRIQLSTRELLLEGMRRVDEWGRLLEQLPPLESVFEVQDEVLVDRLAEIPDEINAILRLFNGKLSVLQVIDAAGIDELQALGAVAKLYFEGIIFDTGRTVAAAQGRPRRIRTLAPAASPREALANGLTERLAPAASPREALANGLTERSSANAAATGVTESVHDVPKSAAAGGAKSAEIANDISRSPLGGVGTSPANATESVTETADPGHLEKGSDSNDEEEGDMSRKARRRRKHKETLRQIEAQAAEESPSNVIQFPAMAVGAGPPVVVRQPSESTAVPEAASAAETTTNVGERSESRKGEVENNNAGIRASERRSATGKAPKRTTSSGMIKAIAGGTGEHAAVTEDFFRAPEDRESDPPEGVDQFDDLEAEEDPATLASHRRYRNIAFGVIGGALLFISLTWLSLNYFSPTEVKIAGEVKPILPSPEMMGDVRRQEAPPAHTAQSASPAPSASSGAALAPAAEATQVKAQPAAVPEVAPAAEPAPAAAAPAEGSTPEAAPPARDYATLLAEARALEGRGKRKQAEEAYRAAANANPIGADALADLAFLLLNRGKNQEAAEFALRATTADPTSSKGWITLGAARQMLGDGSGAREAYRSCVTSGTGRYVGDCRTMAR